MSDKAVILIDGGYFDHINGYCESEFGSRVDFYKLSQKLCQKFNAEHLRTKYYHAYPYKDDDDPTDAQIRSHQKAQSFFDTIDNIDKYQFENKGRVKQERHTCVECGETFRDESQKGVDVGIAVDLVEMAYEQHSPDVFILISGDEDLHHAVDAAKETLSNVYLAYAYNPSYDLYSSQKLRQVVDAKVNIADGFLSNVTEDS